MPEELTGKNGCYSWKGAEKKETPRCDVSFLLWMRLPDDDLMAVDDKDTSQTIERLRLTANQLAIEGVGLYFD